VTDDTKPNRALGKLGTPMTDVQLMAKVMNWAARPGGFNRKQLDSASANGVLRDAKTPSYGRKRGQMPMLLPGSADRGPRATGKAPHVGPPVLTTKPSYPGYDPRYQVAPGAVVEGCGLVAAGQGHYTEPARSCAAKAVES
jgi:hypothetical protein